jgi:4-hydroxy-3-polyprenylbenzoate decarboxylase
MAYKTLTDFLTVLEDDGELVRVAVEVDARFEVAEITQRLCALLNEGQAEGGPAVFFENVTGSELPLVTNLFGSRRRLCRAFDAESFEEIAQRAAGIVQPHVPESWFEALKVVPKLTQLAGTHPRGVNSGVCQQVVKMGSDVDLTQLPLPTCWPHDAGPVISAGQVITKHPETGVRDVSVAPCIVDEGRSVLVAWDTQGVGWRNFEAYRRVDLQMPVAIVLGGDPVSFFTAHAPLPPDIDAYRMAGILREQPIDLIRCRSIDLEVPADAEIVIEGTITPGDPLVETTGIGQPTGFAGPDELLPRMNASAVTHRANPVCPGVIVGPPPTEILWLERLTERCLLPFVRLFVPEILDIHFPTAGVFRNLVFAKIDKQMPGQARKVMNALWSLPMLSTTKIVIVVDKDVDVRDEDQVWFHVGANVHPGRDVAFWEGPTHTSDHAAPTRGLGYKMGIDATRKSRDENHPRAWPELLESSEEIRDRVSRRWTEYGFGPRDER